jgi:hypothetical protein
MNAPLHKATFSLNPNGIHQKIIGLFVFGYLFLGSEVLIIRLFVFVYNFITTKKTSSFDVQFWHFDESDDHAREFTAELSKFLANCV